jgi:hypothetical protein
MTSLDCRKGTQSPANVSLGGSWLGLRTGLTDAVLGISRNYVPQAAEGRSLVNPDFELPRGSPAFQLGFKPIPFREIGPRESAEQSRKD